MNARRKIQIEKITESPLKPGLAWAVTRRRRRRRAPSITVSGATETSGERVKTPVNENENENDDDNDNDDHRSARRGHVRPKVHQLPSTAPQQILFLSRAICATIKICAGNKALMILRR